ncbi:MAG: triacylglycerol lipase [uncultured bacterium]|nr:MAG: triacylglycerol lipase [uncultured bacterium]
MRLPVLIGIMAVLLFVTPSFAVDRSVDDPQKAKITTQNLSIMDRLPDSTWKVNFVLVMNYAAMCQMMNFNSEADMLSVYPNTLSLDFPRFKNKAYIIKDAGNGIQTIVFRGSGNIRNAVTDLDFLPKYSEKLKCKVHRGFLKSCLELDPILRPHLDKNRPIRLTGSSLGAGLAAMYGLFLQLDGYDVDAVITFGQPRILNEEGRQLYRESPLYRIVNRTDAVTAIPPHRPFGYVHFGTGIVLVDEETFSLYNESKGERVLENAIVANFWNKLRKKDISIKNHFINVYYDKMANYIEHGVQYKKYNWILPED